MSDLPGFVHGLAAAVLSFAAFYISGLLLAPRRWQLWMRWPDALVLGLTLWVALCWIAISTRGIPLKYVAWIFIGIVWALASTRTRWLRTTLAERLPTRPALRWVTTFGVLYTLACIVIRPAGGPAWLPLGSGDNVALVTYARYARSLLELGTAQVDLAGFGYLHSPAAMFLLAWQSLLFGRDPLQAALPTLMSVTALFGMIAAETARVVFKLTPGLSMAIACVAICGPLLRWVLGSSALGEVVSAVAMLYLVRVAARLVADRALTLSAAACIAAGTALLVFAAPPAGGWWRGLAGGVGVFVSNVRPVSLLAWPGSIPTIVNQSGGTRSVMVITVVFVPIVLTAGAWAVRRGRLLERPQLNDADRRLAGALVVYAGAILIIGNLAVQAFAGAEPVRQPGAWRSLDSVSDRSFRAVTVKVDDAPDGLAAALAMYYLPGRKAEVIGRGGSLQDLPFDGISTANPMFVHNFDCSGVGHDEVESLQGLGCLLWAPPSMAADVPYLFGRTFLFLSFDRLSPREPGGRWNTRPAIQVRVTADPARVALDRDLFVNLLVDPFLPAGATQPLVLNWGADRHGQVSLDEREWFSLPVRSADWKGNRVWSVLVSIEIAGDRRVLFQEIALSATPRGLVASQ